MADDWDARCNWSDDSEAEKKRRGPMVPPPSSVWHASNASRSSSSRVCGGGRVRTRGVVAALVVLVVLVVWILPTEHHYVDPGAGEGGEPGDSGQYANNAASSLALPRGTEPAMGDEPDGSTTLMILMLSDNPYQVWQMRAFHYHYLKVRQPGKLVTIVSSKDHAKPSFSCSEPFMTCPIYVVDDYSEAPDGDVFVVYNRAWGLVEFLTEFRAGKVAGLDPAVLTNIVLVEPDFLLIKPITAVAGRQSVLGHHYFYMEKDYPWANNSAVFSGCTPRPELMAPIGVPYIIHADDLWQLLPTWIESTRWNRFPQPWADGAKSWIADMWGFACAAATLGFKAHALPDLAPEPPMDADITTRSVAIHYTYGQEVGSFTFNKRAWWNAPLPRPLPPLPDEASPLQHLWYDLLNEALLNVFGKGEPSPDDPVILAPTDPVETHS